MTARRLDARPDRPSDSELLIFAVAHAGRLKAAAAERGWPERTFYGWLKAARERAGEAAGQSARTSGASADGLSGGRPSSEPDSAPNRTETRAQPDGTLEVVTTGTVRTLDGLLEAASIDPKDWHVETWTANKWDGITTRGTGQDRTNAVVELWQVKARLVRQPSWYVQPVAPIVHLRRAPSLPGDRGLRVALVIPDTQHGYRYDARRRALSPLHDRRAWDVYVQAAALLRPDHIWLLGDHLDLAPWSDKYPTSAGLRFTTAPAVRELHWGLGQLRIAAPSARILYRAGNHEDRIDRALVRSLPEAETLRPADDPDGHAALSVPRLLALDALDVEYAGPYGTDTWVDGVRVHHGSVVRRRGGETVAAALRDATAPEVFGHVHRAEVAWRTVHVDGERRHVWAMTPGTGCHIDGRVPGTVRPDWMQALGIVTWDGDQTAPLVVPIHEGRCVLYGQQIEGRERIEEIEAATGDVHRAA